MVAASLGAYWEYAITLVLTRMFAGYPRSPPGETRHRVLRLEHDWFQDHRASFRDALERIRSDWPATASLVRRRSVRPLSGKAFPVSEIATNPGPSVSALSL